MLRKVMGENPVKNASDVPKANAALRLLIYGLAGAAIYMFMRQVFPQPPPSSVLQPPLDPHGSVLLTINLRILKIINSWYVIFPWFLANVYLAASRRGRLDARLYAFLAGYTLPFITFHWILRWF